MEVRQGNEKAKEARRKQRGRSMMLLGFGRDGVGNEKCGEGRAALVVNVN